MTTFIRLVDEPNKEPKLRSEITSGRLGIDSECRFETNADEFLGVPEAPFCYWVSSQLRESFTKLSKFEQDGREGWMGLSTGANFQWLRLFWEIPSAFQGRSKEATKVGKPWVPLSKGGEYLSYCPDIHMLVNWKSDGEYLDSWKKAELEMGRITANNSQCWNKTKYFRPGLTWSVRSLKGLSFRILPRGCIFGSKGPGLFVDDDDESELLAYAAVVNSAAFKLLVSIQMAAASYEVGVLKRTPVPSLNPPLITNLEKLALRIWELEREIAATNEISIYFVLPEQIYRRINGAYDIANIRAEIASLQKEVDLLLFELYGFQEEDICESERLLNDSGLKANSVDCEAGEVVFNQNDLFDLGSWLVGIAFGRFDMSLAVEECELPENQGPLEPLPLSSPGVLASSEGKYHFHEGILVDDPGHPHDLPELMESVLERVDVHAPENLRRWLRRDFFKEHLKQYSKSRRKAPIYWPLSTASGSYTLWIYYPYLDDQTLYTTINDFLEPKLKLVGDELNSLRSKSNRSAAEERELEKQQDLKKELIELRDTILEIAPTYKPNHDDGVQITAAPLWPLFRHKPWQKVLKGTWEKLETGEYDWAHLAYSYWPDRVREKCKSDKSLAIVHDFEEPAA